MNSLDTNILVYASNADCREHPKAAALMERVLTRPSEWMIADQVLWELYRVLRHPKILAAPRSAAQAAAQVRFLREKSGVARCCAELSHFDDVLAQLERPRFPYQRTHDCVLGVTLVNQGVKTFYTRNEKDFVGAGFQKIVNPIDS